MFNEMKQGAECWCAWGWVQGAGCRVQGAGCRHRQQAPLKAGAHAVSPLSPQFISSSHGAGLKPLWICLALALEAQITRLPLLQFPLQLAPVGISLSRW